MTDEAIDDKIVLGEGPGDARLMIVGEAPGTQEERLGKPFVGPAGKFLDGELAAVGINRAAVYVTNAVKRRPVTTAGRTRRPFGSEIRKWRSVLWREIESVRPVAILCLGSVAMSAVLGSGAGISRNRGKWVTGPMGIRSLATFHPAYVRRGGQKVKALFRSDIELVAKELAKAR